MNSADQPLWRQSYRHDRRDVVHPSGGYEMVENVNLLSRMRYAGIPYGRVLRAGPTGTSRPSAPQNPVDAGKVPVDRAAYATLVSNPAIVHLLSCELRSIC